MDQLTDFVNALSNFIYQPYMIPALLVVAGGYLTVRTGFVQIRHFGTALKMVLAGISKQKSAGIEGTITPFQALSTALASTVGNGNIGGVATAILVGGPGAIFWMWVTAAVGMATKYSEAVLGVHYRVTTATGELASGPMYYISNGLKGKSYARPLAQMFCLFGAATALLGTGNMAQSNTIAQTFMKASEQTFGTTIDAWVPGVLITVACGLVLLGGIQRIALVAERLVPSMIVIYLVMGFAYIFMNLDQIPHVFALIFGNAFTPSAAAGGFIGASVSSAIAAGVSRGVLSNEAGLGSAPIAHGIAKVKHPSEQGVVGVFEVFMDTVIVCSMTAFIILSSGMWQDAAYQNASGDLTAAALNTQIPYASALVALCSFLFGFSTLIGWYYYGEKCFEYLFGAKGIFPYRVIYTILILIGAVVPVPLVWAIGTLLNGFMAFPNLIGLIMLGGVVARLTKDFFSNRVAEA
ncbi:MAG TPA: sodium:alanine symporter family protein [Vicinamibacteria bacterium]|nr:sodium:alanine symporter family protein [Vicinamibacteria bacterium]